LDGVAKLLHARNYDACQNPIEMSGEGASYAALLTSVNDPRAR
jgi:hypothetical protein